MSLWRGSEGKDDIGHRVRSLYRGHGVVDRVHVRGRIATMPLGSIVETVGRSQEVLDLGCGHGIVTVALSLEGADRRIHAVDIDGRKVRSCRRVVTEALPGAAVRVEQVDPAWLPEPASCDAVVIADVLYLLDDHAARALLAAAAGAVRAGGVVVVAEIDPLPSWRGRIARAQEFLACRVLHLTSGRLHSFRPPADFVGWLEECGLVVELHEPERHGIAAHAIVSGRR